MPSAVGLHVAIYNDEGVYKHWSLFIDGPTDGEKTILQAMGESTRYRFEMEKSNAREAANLSELIHLCDVDVSQIGAIKAAAGDAVIHNEFPGYNCQDYVLELLDDLEKRNIIDSNNADYQRKKRLVKAKQEGF